MRYYYNRNSYWSSYTQIESEFINLSHSVYFDDEQLKVYSAKFSDMILSICSKIESISKDFFELHLYPFYKDGTKNIEYSKRKIKDITKWERKDWFFDNDCLSNMNELLLLDKKAVKIYSHHFHLDVHTDELIPFANIKKDGKYDFFGGKWETFIKPKQIFMSNRKYENINWLKSYQEIKHNYSESLKKHGTLQNVIMSLAALFLLLIYMDLYQTGIILDPDYFNSDKMSNSFTSELFSVVETSHTTPRSLIFDNGAWSNNDRKAYKDSCVLLRIYSKETYENFMKIINIYFTRMNTNQVTFYMDSLSINKNTTEEEVLFKEIMAFEERHRYVGHYSIVLNQNEEDVYSIYDFNHMSYERTKYQNHRQKSLQDMQIGDIIIFSSHLDTIKGELLEKTDFFLKVKTNEGSYQAPISDMYDISILKAKL